VWHGEHRVECQDHAVFVVERRVMLISRQTEMVRFGVTVSNDVVMSVGVGRLVDVLHRRHRNGGDGNDKHGRDDAGS